MVSYNVLYDLEDFTIIPEPVSNVRHRGEINACYTMMYNNTPKRFLPIFVSPMECVINEKNFQIYENNGVIPILPRTELLSKRLLYSASDRWAAYSLSEFEKYFTSETYSEINKIMEENDIADKRIKVLIDNANGHMKSVADAVKLAKGNSSLNGYTIEIMVGNIANPLAYENLAKAGADYVRCAVGNGNCCITASQTATNYPLGSLTIECKEIKDKNKFTCKIIADGGISSYKRAILALALGADFVMIGSTFGKCFESSSEFISFDKPSKAYTYYSLNDVNSMRFKTDVTEETKKDIIKMYAPLNKTVWGMSTRRAQISIGLAEGKKLCDIKTKTSEGVEKVVTCDYTLHQWVENFADYLRSQMSYSNIFDVYDYIGYPHCTLVSQKARDVINK